MPYFCETFAGDELALIEEALAARSNTGDGSMVLACEALLRELTDAEMVCLTPSGTAALEMAALLAGVEPGDEVIMPSFTFTSTANAFVLRGAIPVFVDIRPDTLNIDETLIESAITPRTRAIVPVHYAGVSAAMGAIMDTARAHDLMVIEDAAQAIGASYAGRALGTIGEMGALSFHGSKNVSAGEGGALLLRDSELCARAEIIREKGTNRSLFLRGEIAKYTWEDVGSSYLLSNVAAAYLLAQLRAVEKINARRLVLWRRYFEALRPLEDAGALRLPNIPPESRHNAHLFFVIFADEATRAAASAHLGKYKIGSVRHYVPLHSAPAGRRFARTPAPMPVTEAIGDSLLRLPLYPDLADAQQDEVIDALRSFCS